MDNTTFAVQFLNYIGEGAYVPVLLAGIGAFSTIATVYPANWYGAATVHKLALMIGNAKPAVPATSVATVISPAILAPAPVDK